MSDSYYHFVFMPYIHMGDCSEVDFGFLKLWNFDKKKDELIQDVQLLSRMTELMNTYQDRNMPIRGMGVFLLQPGRLNSLNQQTKIDIRDARLILFLSFLAENNTTFKDGNTMHSMATSENLMIIYQGTHLPSDF